MAQRRHAIVNAVTEPLSSPAGESLVDLGRAKAASKYPIRYNFARGWANDIDGHERTCNKKRNHWRVLNSENPSRFANLASSCRWPESDRSFPALKHSRIRPLLTHI